jgi:methyl-accepting chemotaxis protein
VAGEHRHLKRETAIILVRKLHSRIKYVKKVVHRVTTFSKIYGSKLKGLKSMDKFMTLTIRKKLILIVFSLGLISLLTSAWLFFHETNKALNKANGLAQEALEAQVSQKLTSLAEVKRTAVESYFEQIKNQILTFSENRMIADAMFEFKVTAGNLFNEIRFASSEANPLQSELQDYYQDDFVTEYRRQNPGKTAPVQDYLKQLDNTAVAMQYAYIRANPHPLGSKHRLDKASAVNATYNRAHQKYHPLLRSYLQKFGYYDIFLVDHETGRIVYSVFKELDYGTSLLNGPFADTDLGEVFRKANAADDKDAVVFMDYAQYTPSYEAPASFIASPIFDNGKKMGVLIFQMPLDRITQVMSERAGLGETGETYLVGPDGLMRSDSYREPARFNVVTVFRNPLASKVETPSLQAALAGRTGVDVITAYHGNQVLSAYTPVKIGADTTWALVAEMDKDEAFSAMAKMEQNAADTKTKLLQNAALILGIINLVVLVLSWLFAGRIGKALLRTAQALKAVAAGDLSQRLEVTSQDELGEMATALNRTVQGMRNALGAEQVDWDEVAKFFLEMRADLTHIKAMVEGTPCSLMMVDPDLKLSYMNPATQKLLKRVEDHLPIPVDKMIGQSIDIFHKNPAHQRQFLSDPGNFPHRAMIRLGEEDMELQVNAIYDQAGNYHGLMASWEIMTEKLAEERKKMMAATELERLQAAELQRKVDSLLAVVKAAAAGDLTQSVPLQGDDAVGQVGEGLTHLFEALRMSIRSIGQHAQTLAGSAEEFTAVSVQMSTTANGTAQRADEVSASARHVSGNVEALSAAAEEMTASIREIAQHSAEAARIASAAVAKADTTNATVRKLGDSSTGIGQVVQVITSIAEQTNLLALNATIEAARAGDAGKGFAVVANEVKELAKATAQATDEISQKISAIQIDTSEAVIAIGEIGDIIEQINALQTTVAGAVEEQTATTNEISRSVAEAAQGSGEITGNITQVAEDAQDTLRGTHEVHSAAAELAQMAAQLQQLVGRFRVEPQCSSKANAA